MCFFSKDFEKSLLLIFDIEGVLLEKNQALLGSKEFLDLAYSSTKEIFFLSNTTSYTKEQMLEKFRQVGFSQQIQKDHIITGLSVLEKYIKEKSVHPYLLVDASIEPYLKQWIKDPQAPYDSVIIGNAKQNFTFDLLNEALNILLQDNVALVSCARSRKYSVGKNQFSLDSGAYTVLLEYASQKKATILGKPSNDFFLMPVIQSGIQPTSTILFGDDFDNDILPALDLQMQTVLIKTGKGAQYQHRQDESQPHYVFSDFRELLKSLSK